MIETYAIGGQAMPLTARTDELLQLIRTLERTVGELRECDPQLCGWIAGPQVGNHRMVQEQS